MLLLRKALFLAKKKEFRNYYAILLSKLLPNIIGTQNKDYYTENQSDEKIVIFVACNVVLDMYLFLLQVLYKFLSKQFWRDTAFLSFLSI